MSDLTRRFVSFVLAAALFGVGKPALAARYRRQIALAGGDDDDSPLEPDDDDAADDDDDDDGDDGD